MLMLYQHVLFLFHLTGITVSFYEMLGRKKGEKRLKKHLRECWSTPIGSTFAKPRREAFRSLSNLRSKKNQKTTNHLITLV